MNKLLEACYFILPFVILSVVAVYPKSTGDIHYDRVTTCECLGYEKIDARDNLYNNPNFYKVSIKTEFFPVCYGIPYACRDTKFASEDSINAGNK